MRLYISGPMTGRPQLNYPAFFTAESQLRDMGYEVSNPAQYPDNGETWAECLRRDLKDLLECDGVAALPGWQKSKGARLEVNVARRLGMEVMDVKHWKVRWELWRALGV